MFNGRRFAIARERRAMTKRGVASALNLTPNTILRYETGSTVPAEETVERIAGLLGFPVSFFSGDDLEVPRRDNASFRGLASKSDRIMDAALASGALAYVFDDWMRAEFGSLPVPDLPDLSGQPPELAASMLRQHWRLGDKPIENMVHLLEAKGVRVFSLAENTKDVDAFSLWRDDIPYVFLNRFKSAEKSRFDAAHELAHLCIHKHGGAVAINKNSLVEVEANKFAGTFLMPESDLRATIKVRSVSVDDLIAFKKRWRVAAVALAYRCLEIGLIPANRKESVYVEMSRRGWLRDEPEGIKREQSAILQQVMDALREDGTTKQDISRKCGVPIGELEALLFGLANMVSIEGEGARTPPKQDHLRLVS